VIDTLEHDGVAVDGDRADLELDLLDAREVPAEHLEEARPAADRRAHHAVQHAILGERAGDTGNVVAAPGFQQRVDLRPHGVVRVRITIGGHDARPEVR
jgi:hypothetical protein